MIKGDARFEIVRSCPRPSIHDRIDQGSIGRANRPALYDVDKGALRGQTDNDTPHRSHNNVLLALGWSDNNWAKCEIALTCSVASIPFGKCTFFWEQSEAAEEFFENFDIYCALFESNYPAMSFEMHKGKLPLNYGTITHEMAKQSETIVGVWFRLVFGFRIV